MPGRGVPGRGVRRPYKGVRVRLRGRACPICAKILYPIYADLTALPREERGHLGYALAARFSEIDGQRVPVRHRRRQRQRWIDGLAQLMQRETELPPPAGDLMAWGTSIPRGKYRGRCGWGSG